MNRLAIESVWFPKDGAWGQLVLQSWLFGGIAPCLAGAIVLQTSFLPRFLAACALEIDFALNMFWFCLQTMHFKTTSFFPLRPPPSQISPHTHTGEA